MAPTSHQPESFAGRMAQFDWPSMSAFGYLKVSQYLNATELAALKSETEALIHEHYTPANLSSHAVYPSDKSEARESHAMMLSEGTSDLPKIPHDPNTMIGRVLREQNQILSHLTGQPVAASSRSLLNYQNYRTGNKPVGEHFDGEYLRAEKHRDGIEFNLAEGILPRYVGVLVVADANDGRGVELLDNHRHHTYQPRLHPGDLVLFDNINLRHRVPALSGPRISIGLRNFDHRPWHFCRDTTYQRPEGTYHRIPEGWVAEDCDCHARMMQFMAEEWPRLQAEYGSYV